MRPPQNESPFLTAEWRHLAIVNFDVDPVVLQPRVPAGTELDDWRGRTFLSIVGFLFRKTRVLGLGIPFHRDFEEVNLRFYVRRKTGGEWRRAVVFVKEIVPRAAIAVTARALYGEQYVALRMQHSIESGESGNGSGGWPKAVSYSWWFRGRENRIQVSAAGEPHLPEKGSDEEFIAEHYWGYARRRGPLTTEYRVRHPQWRITRASVAHFDCDVSGVYGGEFADFVKLPAASSFLAEGSKVEVFPGTPLHS